MEIIIKSFNRPHYLDRCLQSIQLFVKGYDKITVLDDGTPQKYLDLILQKYPTIEIKKSNQYLEKSKSIQNHSFDTDKINGFTIPTDMWVEAVKQTKDYVLVTEDDVWFTQKVDFDELVNTMKLHQIELMKLGWLGNLNDDRWLEVSQIEGDVYRTIPQNIFTANEWLMDCFMFNRYKFFSLLYRLKLVTNETKRKYWTLNSILMGLYHKDYWLYMWKDSVNKLDEKIQLRNAAVYYHQHKKNSNLIARSEIEYMKTTFKSTASGVYHDYALNLDVNRVNHILNEAWSKGELDVMQNFPNDFADEYIKSFLEKSNHPDAQFSEWQKWTEKFRAQYRNLGAEVDY
ncbi:glycosyltransferase family 2 protein [Empedobacter falsenii]